MQAIGGAGVKLRDTAVVGNAGAGLLADGTGMVSIIAPSFAPAKITQSAVVGTRGGAQKGADGLDRVIGPETGGGDGVVIEGTSDDGETCESCALGFAGANCDKCALGFTGANCDVCSGGFGGAACDTCKDSFYGPACIACACGDGQGCDEGKGGTGACTCLDGFVDVDVAPENGCECQDQGVETCNGLEDDCDSATDEDGAGDPGAMTNVYPDTDGDGFDDSAASPVCACVPPPGTTLDKTDCDDSSPIKNVSSPSAAAWRWATRPTRSS